MSVGEVLDGLTSELAGILSGMDEDGLSMLERDVLSASRIFVAGAGRSGLMVRALAMRLMHLGLVTYVVGETVTPAIGPTDLLLVASASGSTSTLVAVAERARMAGARVALVTAHGDSPLAELAGSVLVVPAYTAKVPGDAARGSQLGGSSFEQAVLLLGDALATHIAQVTGQGNEELLVRHANLE